MILTCPNCATDFFIDDHLIGADGRKVKCDECGEIWTAAGSTPLDEPEPEDPVELAATPEPTRSPESSLFPPARAAALAAARKRPFPWRRVILGLLVVLALAAVLFALQRNSSSFSPAAADAHRSLGLARSSPQISHG